jgi:hypothetical protein
MQRAHGVRLFMVAVVLGLATAQQPPPPNTAITVFATVAGTTQANGLYWAVECLKVPADATFIMLDMGSVRDFFKPVDGATMCQMLASTTNKQHQWSPNGVDWVVPTSLNSNFHGGSSDDWPSANTVGDTRYYLSFWGSELDYKKGGCCCIVHADSCNAGWTQSFSLAYAVPLQPPPPNTAITVIATVAGSIQANDAYWAVECLKVPAAATFLMLDMGSVRDFYKPIEVQPCARC